jgi:hypothetical protein
MKITAMLFAFVLFWGLKDVRAQEVTLEISEAEKQQIAADLDKEAEARKNDRKTSQHLKKVADIFRTSKSETQIEVVSPNQDCVNCEESKQNKAKDFFTKLGRTLGRGSAWFATTTAKPFMAASGFVTGAVEKKDKNEDITALYKFFLNHSEEFDELYLEAGTPQEMVELMLAKMEDIMEDKSRIIMRDFLQHLGINKEIPDDMSDFELTAEEIASIDRSKLDPSFINNHPEYQEVKPLVGEMTKQDLMDIIESGYLDKSISFDNYKQSLPKPHELVTTLVGQIFAPRIAIGIISKSLVGLYSTPLLLSQIGTGVSAAICLQNATKEKFETDKDLKSFCSYVTNRSAYQLVKSRAKGYVAGKNFRLKVNQKIQDRKERRAEKRRLKEEERSQREQRKASNLS